VLPSARKSAMASNQKREKEDKYGINGALGRRWHLACLI
jgi:hypothetical protein